MTKVTEAGPQLNLAVRHTPERKGAVGRGWGCAPLILTVRLSNVGQTVGQLARLRLILPPKFTFAIQLRLSMELTITR